VVVGKPDTVIRQIQQIKDAVGINHFNCSFWFGDLDQKRVLKSMELFAREVMPAFGEEVRNQKSADFSDI